MADISWMTEDPGQASHRRGWGRALGWACLWLSLAALTLVVVGLGASAVLGVAHHAAPAGGGG